MSSSRFTSPLTLVVFVALLSIVPRAARAEIVHGFLTGQPDFFRIPGHIACGEAFDFSTQTVVRWDSAGADLCFWAPPTNPSRWVFDPLNGAGLQRVHPTSFEALLVAPELGYSSSTQRIELNAVYVIKTGGGSHGEAIFAKFRVHVFVVFGSSVTIEYLVQLDHSRNLDPLVPVEQSTWGRVKALYQ